MNKQDLVNHIAAKADLTKVQADAALNAVFEGIVHALKKGDDAAFVGFGTFSVAHRAAREGRNPSTGAPIKIAASKQAKFKPGKAFKDALN
jgi:nucleoid DNA-binding protein